MSKTSKIVMRDIRELSAHDRNSRTHSPQQIEKIARAIQEFGFLNPIITAGDKIIAGHARAEAMKMLGEGNYIVPTIDASHLTEAQQRAYIIADNRLSEDSGWDDAILREEVIYLDSIAGFDISTLGFDAFQIDSMRYEEDESLFSAPGAQETEKVETEKPKAEAAPGISQNGYAAFTVVMKIENRSRLQKVLADIRQEHGLTGMEDALMKLVEGY